MASRHQVASTEIELLNGTSSSKICNRDYTIENGKPFTDIRLGHSERRMTLSIPGGNGKNGYSTLKSKSHMADNEGEDICIELSKENTVHDHEKDDMKNRYFDGDVIPQWGQRKRQRNGRFEFKAAVAEESEDTFLSPTKSTKTVRNVNMIQKHDRCLQAHVRPKRLLPISRTCNTSPASCVNRSRNGDVSANHLSRHNIDNSLSGSDEKAQIREISPLSEKPDTVAYHTRTASGSSFAANIQGGAEVELHQRRPPVVERTNMQSIEWPKFMLFLSRKEKEDDFLTVKGSKLPQRPKKRPRHVEKWIQLITPGMWLPDLTKERYEVREKKAVKKGPRGLKAMCTSHSDSE